MMILTLLVPFALAAPQSLTAKQVMERVQAAYDSVKTIEVSVTGRIRSSTGSANISFQRPGKLRVSGKSLYGQRYDLLCDGKQSWIMTNGGTWEKAENPEMAVAGITGLSAGSGTEIPALLMHMSWGRLLTPVPSDLSVKPVKVGNRQTLLLSSNTPAQLRVWVDAKTFFLIKSERTSEGFSSTVDFATPKVNKSIPAARFEK